jgi:hypothetical protein
VVEILSPNRPDQSLYKGMRQWHERNGLDFGYLEYAKICLPLVKSIQRIMIGAEVLRQIWTANCSLEHPAQRYSIHDAAMHAKADDSPRKLVHQNENPKSSQGSRFASE